MPEQPISDPTRPSERPLDRHYSGEGDQYTSCARLSQPIPTSDIWNRVTCAECLANEQNRENELRESVKHWREAGVTACLRPVTAHMARRAAMRGRERVMPADTLRDWSQVTCPDCREMAGPGELDDPMIQRATALAEQLERTGQHGMAMRVHDVVDELRDRHESNEGVPRGDLVSLAGREPLANADHLRARDGTEVCGHTPTCAGCRGLTRQAMTLRRERERQRQRESNPPERGVPLSVGSAQRRVGLEPDGVVTQELIDLVDDMPWGSEFRRMFPEGSPMRSGSQPGVITTEMMNRLQAINTELTQVREREAELRAELEEDGVDVDEALLARAQARDQNESQRVTHMRVGEETACGRHANGYDWTDDGGRAERVVRAWTEASCQECHQRAMALANVPGAETLEDVLNAPGVRDAVETLQRRGVTVDAESVARLEEELRDYQEMMGWVGRIQPVVDRHRAEYGETLDVSAILREVTRDEDTPWTFTAAMVITGLMDEERISSDDVLALLARYRAEHPVEASEAAVWVERIRTIQNDTSGTIGVAYILERLGFRNLSSSVAPPALQAALAVCGFLPIRDVSDSPAVEGHLRTLGLDGAGREELVRRAMATEEGRAALRHTVSEAEQRGIHPPSVNRPPALKDLLARNQATSDEHRRAIPRPPTRWDRIGDDDADE